MVRRRRNLVPGTMCIKSIPKRANPKYLVFPFVRYYNIIVDVSIRFSKSAFKHGVSEVDIRMAFDNNLYDERLDDSDEVEEIDARYLLIGFDRNANLLEVLYNIIDENTLKVFHAMKCSNIYLPLIKYKE
jgi:uncharacterized DUF497 family protein